MYVSKHTKQRPGRLPFDKPNQEPGVQSQG